eukprot:gb/GEZJ01001349.1/.p1 GENE.gb/GEZJ01001349.1/~~gb/GEZJ01001349.1/.p1  ORF type:complete len:877 (-),score=121.70 gb/GEZJ01001349.1/:82-2445(-)
MASNSDTDNVRSASPRAPPSLRSSSSSLSPTDPAPVVHNSHPHHHRLDDHQHLGDGHLDDKPDSEQQCILIPNYRGVAHSSALPDRACAAHATSSAQRVSLSDADLPQPHPPQSSKNVSFDMQSPNANPPLAASSLLATSSFSTSLMINDHPSDSSTLKTPQQSLQQASTPELRPNQSKLSSTMQQLHKGTSSENSDEPKLHNSLPKRLSNGDITYSSSVASTSCTSQPFNAMHIPSPGSSSSAAPALSNAAKSFTFGRDRPASSPAHPQALQNISTAHVFSLYASPSSGRRFCPRTYRPAPVPTSNTMSFLECVLEMLKGSTVHKRRTFMYHPQIYLWLTPDLCELRYRCPKKGNVPITETLPLCRVSKLKGSDRELSIEFSDARKRVEFLFPSKGNADIWLSGLCCLIPAYASVKSRDRPVGQRENYDPLTDSWNGKKIESRKRLASYILLGTIGRGSFGKVKLALSVENRQFYAVKVLNKSMMRKRIRSIPVNGVYTNSADFTELEAKDVNEIQVMEALRHENVMQYMGVYNDTEDDRFYIVLEFVARGPIMSSAKLKGANPLSIDRARSAFVDVLAGIEYLHRMSIAHRDIKPDNLLEAGDGTVKISDFGAAVECKRDADGTFVSDHSTAGTPAFTAPEVTISDNGPKKSVNLLKADMWSLGATLYYMIFGEAPFIARSVFEMYDTICTQELSFPGHADASSDVCCLISALLQKDPAKRADITECLRSPWITKCAGVAEKVDSVWRAIEKHGGRADRPQAESGAATVAGVGGQRSRTWYKKRS